MIDRARDERSAKRCFTNGLRWGWDVIPGKHMKVFVGRLVIGECSNVHRSALLFVAMSPLVHLALAQIKPRKGDYRGNLERLRSVFAQARRAKPRPTVLCLPRVR